MKLNFESLLSLDDLKGAWIADENGKNFRIDDFFVDMSDGLGTDDFARFDDVWVTLVPIDLQTGEFSKTENKSLVNCVEPKPTAICFSLIFILYR